MLKKTIKNIIYPLIKSPPNFLIIGTQKGGTTSLARYLEEHPQIIPNNSWKEVRYYDVSENYNKGWGWYLGNFAFKWQTKDLLTFDATPNYLYFSNIPELIKKDFPQIKMIVLLRNPVDRAYSGWQMYHSFGNNSYQMLKDITDYRSFSEAIKEELNPALNTAKYPYNYINRGKYVQQLENYYRYFDKDNLLILDFEMLKNNLDLLLNQVCDFLEIEKFSSSQLNKLKEEKHNVGKYQKTDEDKETIEFLIEYFKPFNEKLYELLNYSYNW
ncbi:sulfotransferase domain-containing protein [Geminocystis sp.]|uniref:sulfotransferase domain-containing protein n=1 Tax=Geminocystis sp. TaxID=2664100 RepID=UPI0035947D83